MNEQNQQEPAQEPQSPQGAEDAQATEPMDKAYIGKLRHEAAEYRTKLRDAQTERDTLAEQVKTLGENLSAAKATVRERTIRRLAAEYLRDPDDVSKFIDTDAVQVGDDLSIDEDSIRTSLKELTEGKPYLAPDRGVNITPPSGLREHDPRPASMADFFDQAAS